MENSDQDWLLGLLAFAIFEEGRIEWAQHIVERDGRSPTMDEVTKWYSDQPASALLRARGAAESALVAYGGSVVEEADRVHRDEVERGIIVGEIRALRRFWPQFGVNVAAGFASAFLFAAFLVVFWFSTYKDISPSKIGEIIGGTLDGGQSGG
ncbi:MAG: hypothetical protein RIM80_11475 [Alphaproteobacteria bacterium]